MKNKNYAYELRTNYHLTWQAIGENLGVSRKTARRLYDQYLLEKINKPNVDSVVSIDRFRPLHVQGNAAITCDWHIPLHSPWLVNKLFEKATDAGVKKLIIAGDFFNMDTFSHFLPHQPEAKFELEKEAATDILSTALDIFDTVYLSWGNHDFRIVRFLDHKLGFEYCMRWVLEGLGEEKLSRVKFSELDHIVYDDLDIRICHQKNFSSVPLTVPLQLVKKFHTNVMTAHSHHFAQGASYDGGYRVYEGGGLFDSTRTEYVQRTTTHHMWTPGFYIAKDGLMHAYSPLYNNL